jgi:hypothetical protein
MAGRGDPIETVNSIAWTIDLVDDAFELTGFAIVGAGMLALAWPTMRRASSHVAWGRYTAVLAAVLLATAAAYAAQEFDLVDLLLIVGGALLLPFWLAWTGRLLREPGAVP